MATKKFYEAQTNFTSGQWSSDMEGRTDIQQYKNAAKTITNWLPDIRGGLKTKPGSVFVAEVLDNTAVTSLIRFEFSSEQAYAIEAGNLYFRYFTDQGRVQEASQTITGAADNGSGLIRISVASHGYSNGDYVAIRSVVGTIEANGDFSISGVVAGTFDLVGSTFTNTYTSGGTAALIVQDTTPYLTASFQNG